MTYQIFISHVFDYKEHYLKVKDELNKSSVNWKNFSIDEHKKFDSNVKQKIEKNIKSANRVIILSGIYASHSEWIKWEYEKAVENNKKIIAIKPWSNTKLPSFISNSNYENLEIIGWNPSLIPNKL